ncbi:MAG: selenide, water dikinase SelD [Planctomycetota bacterium]
MPQNVDLAKRRRIMQRSMKLGHCICDPKRPCPCNVFTQDGYCPCAGERPDTAPADNVKLTELVHNAGCASKIAPADLETVLKRLPPVSDPAVLCGLPAGDDAGVYRLPDGTCLVQTVDVMTPVVDDAETFGRICAANCLSDIYAMGGTPLTALSILAFPSETQDGELMYRMMKGAMDVLGEAGVALIGGHSVKDEEIKLGFAITGTIDAEAAVSHGSAKVGDVLVLTKPLGAGVLNFCRQIGRNAPGLAEAEASMATLNRDAAEAMNAVGVSAATDVTGFGLYGHLISMARHSGVTAQVWADRLGAFPGAIEALEDDVVPGAIERNREFVADDIAIASDVAAGAGLLGFDAQTSGGLLMAVPEAKLADLREQLQRRNTPAMVIGKVVAESDGRIVVTTAKEAVESAGLRDIVDTPGGEQGRKASCGGAQSGESSCCPGSEPDEASGACCSAGREAGTAGDSLKAFGALMRSAGAGGTIDETAKELITFALVLLSKCEPCFEAHWAKAANMGISREQLDEAAWCAIAMGGAPVRMFYEQMKSRVDADHVPGRGCC